MYGEQSHEGSNITVRPQQLTHSSMDMTTCGEEAKEYCKLILFFVNLKHLQNVTFYQQIFFLHIKMRQEALSHLPHLAAHSLLRFLYKRWGNTFPFEHCKIYQLDCKINRMTEVLSSLQTIKSIFEYLWGIFEKIWVSLFKCFAIILVYSK